MEKVIAQHSPKYGSIWEEAEAINLSLFLLPICGMMHCSMFCDNFFVFHQQTNSNSVGLITKWSITITHKSVSWHSILNRIVSHLKLLLTENCFEQYLDRN